MLNEIIKSILNNLKLCKDHEDVNQEDINKCFRYLMAYPENISYSNIIDNKYKFSQYQWFKLKLHQFMKSQYVLKELNI
jgi:hypothetical protein